MRKKTTITNSCHLLAICLIGAAISFTGCREHMPHSGTWPATGDEIKTHPKPPEGGYYSDWDPFAGSISLEPLEDTNPVKTQHILIATVRDKDGKPLPNRRVEWVISNGSVGDIVEVDESGWRASRGMKITNHFAISHTNNYTHTLTRGNDDPSDDIDLNVGDTWCVITSPIEGDTYITAYAPGIFDWNKHKVFAIKHWYDVAWKYPPPARNPTGTPHELVTRVMKISDGTPLAGYIVNYTLLDGPAGTFEPGKANAVSVLTDGAGIARVILNQAEPTEGLNNIQVDIIRPADEQCCKPARHIATGRTTKEWFAPKLTIEKDAPAHAIAGEAFMYNIIVTNPSMADALQLNLTDPLPPGIEYISSSPPADVAGSTLTWNWDRLSARRKRSIAVNVRAVKTGHYTNCAEVVAAQNLSARDCAETEVTAPGLKLDVQCIGDAILCDPLPVTLYVSNPGDAPTSRVMVSATLPNGLHAENGQAVVAFDAGTLEPGQTKRTTLTLKADNPGRYTIKATATADGNLTAEASCDIMVRLPVLVVTKTGPEKRYLGRPATYEITVMNKGDAPARNTVLVDDVPSGMGLMQVSDNAAQARGKLTWNLGTILAGQSKKVSLTLQANEKGTMRNTAKATAYCCEGSASNSTEVEGMAAVLLEVIDIEDPIEVGKNSTYQINVTNQGTAVATNIVVECMLPPEQQYVTAEGPAKTVNGGQQVTFAAVPALQPGGVLVYRITVKGLKPGDVRFRATMKTDQTVTIVEETESTHIY